jgi:hypothetical protein
MYEYTILHRSSNSIQIEMEEAVCRVISSNWQPLSVNPRFVLNSVQGYHLATIRFEVNPNMTIVRCQCNEISDMAHRNKDSLVPHSALSPLF